MVADTPWVRALALFTVIYVMGMLASIGPAPVAARPSGPPLEERPHEPLAEAPAAHRVDEPIAGPIKWADSEPHGWADPPAPVLIDLPPQIESEPFRQRLLSLLGGAPPSDPLDGMDVTLHPWCVHEVSSALRISLVDAQSLIDDALLSSTTTAGDAFLSVLERAAMPTDEHLRARRMCATELFYALPGEEPE